MRVVYWYSVRRLAFSRSVSHGRGTSCSRGLKQRPWKQVLASPQCLSSVQGGKSIGLEQVPVATKVVVPSPAGAEQTSLLQRVPATQSPSQRMSSVSRMS